MSSLVVVLLGWRQNSKATQIRNAYWNSDKDCFFNNPCLFKLINTLSLVVAWMLIDFKKVNVFLKLIDMINKRFICKKLSSNKLWNLKLFFLPPFKQIQFNIILRCPLWNPITYKNFLSGSISLSFKFQWLLFQFIIIWRKKTTSTSI